MTECVICGNTENVTVEPRFLYAICKEHENVPPVNIEHAKDAYHIGLVWNKKEHVWQCPKCKETSGNDWTQCKGECPVTISPHYTQKIVIEHRITKVPYVPPLEIVMGI